MLMPEMHTYIPETGEVPEAQCLLPTELDFYQTYNWCLDPHPTVRELINYLRSELDRFEVVPESWQRGEVVANVFLLSCALLNAVDEYLRGPALRLPKHLATLRLGRASKWATE